MTSTELISKIKAEIDKRYAEYREKMKTDDFTYYEGMADALDLFEQFIDTLESEKPVPKDLEEAAKKYATEWHENPDGSAWKPYFEVSAIKAFIAGAKWQENKVQETIRLAEDHAFLAGADWQKEQMMKGAVEGVVVGDGEHCWIDANIPMNWMYQDKVRVIIVKED